MPNHWHLVLWPQRTIHLSNFARLLTVTHAQRWHAYRKTTGTGPVYQGRYKALPVQSGPHFLQLCRYVERNPLRAGLVERAENWQWSSLWRYGRNCHSWPFVEWPVLRPESWVAIVNGDEQMEVLREIRTAVRRSAPYGDAAWSSETAKSLGIESALKPLGRPKRLPSPFLNS
jgi:putative transposase